MNECLVMTAVLSWVQDRDARVTSALGAEADGIASCDMETRQ